MGDKAEVRVRDAEQVERLAAALVREEIAFDIKPEPDGWWRVRAKVSWPRFVSGDLQALAQTTRRPR